MSRNRVWVKEKDNMKQQGQVIPFPKDQTVRVRLHDRKQNQKALLGLSIVSILMMSVFLNQWVTKPDSGFQRGGRSIASLHPNTNTVAEIKWEHEVARQLASSHELRANLAEKPSLRDELVFGTLEGRYGMKIKDGRVESLEFVGSTSGDEPLIVKDRAAFLRKYSSVFATDFQDVGLASAHDSTETWNLVDSSRTIVGQARLELDSRGRLKALNLVSTQ